MAVGRADSAIARGGDDDPRGDHVHPPELHQRLPPSTTDDDPTQGMGPVAPAGAAAAAAAARSRPENLMALEEARARRRRRDCVGTRRPQVRARTAKASRGRREIRGAYQGARRGGGERCAGSVPRRDAVSEGNRVDLLQRAIDVVRALTKACVDAKRAAAAAPAPAPPPPPPPPEPVRLVVVAQTSVSRAQLADLARRGDAWHSAAFEQRDGRRRPPSRRGCLTAATSLLWETAGPHYHRARRRRNI